MPRRRGRVPKFSDLEVVALSLAAESESIDSEKWLFDSKLQECRSNFQTLFHADNITTVERQRQAYARTYANDWQ